MLKKLGVCLFLAVLLAVVVYGCGKSSNEKPAVARLLLTTECGVAPLAVQMRADGTGGQRVTDPTGGNSFLHIRWDFGDGHGESDGTSVAYHTYTEPDTYTVTVTVEDDNGATATRSASLVVLADTLEVTPYSLVDGMPATVAEACQSVTFGIKVKACDFDPETGFYERFIYRWTMDDANNTVFTGPRPVFAYRPTDTGDHVVHLKMVDPGLSLTRHFDIPISVVDSPGTELSVFSQWLGLAPGDTLLEPNPSHPDTFTYAVGVVCAGPASGYNLKVHGSLPSDFRWALLGASSTQGDVAVNTTNRVWDLTIPSLAAGDTARVDVTVSLTSLSFVGFYYNFTSTLQSYACEGSPADNSTTTVMLITN